MAKKGLFNVLRPAIFIRDMPLGEHKDPNTEEYYKWQCDILANSLLIGDNEYKPDIVSTKVRVHEEALKRYHDIFNFTWPNKGEVVAGSFVMFLQNSSVGEPQDVDVYFKSKSDALEFAALNNLRPGKNTGNEMCYYYMTGYGNNVNLIFGVEYVDAGDLISKFDIRACSMALTGIDIKPDFFGGRNIDVEITNVSQSFYDTGRKEIVFNPNPRGVSVARLVKYVNKGFSVPTYQRLFFAQLVRSEKYNVDVEKFTKY